MTNASDSFSIHTFRPYRGLKRAYVQQEDGAASVTEETAASVVSHGVTASLKPLGEAELAIDADNAEVTPFDVEALSVDPQAKAYFDRHGISSLHTAFSVANILHTHKNVKEAAIIYGLGFRMHSKHSDQHPSAATLLQLRLLCMLKAGLPLPRREVDILRTYNTPFAKYIEGVEMAWSGQDGREALLHMGNAYEEFYTGEEIDCRYLEIATRCSNNLFGKSPEESKSPTIPRNIFMYFDGEMSEKVRENFTYHSNISGYDFKSFNKEEAQEWLYQNYGVEARSLFLNMRHPAEATDFLRVHVTQIYGGWWMDADIRLQDNNAIEFLESQKSDNVFFTEDNYFVHNNFYGTVSNSSIGEDCLLSLYRNSYKYHDLYRAHKTGSGIFNRALNRRVYRTLQGVSVKDDVQIYDAAVFDQLIDSL